MKKALEKRVTPLIQQGVATDAILGAIIDFVRKTLGAQRGTLFLWDRRQRELFSRIADLPELSEIRIPEGSGIAGAAFRERQIIRVADAYKDPRFNPEVDLQTGYRTRSVLALPVLTQTGEPVGVLQLIDSKTDVFSGVDENQLETLRTEVFALLETMSVFLEARNDSVPSSWYNDVIGASAPMREVYRWIKRAAPRSVPVLLEGETGTGKSLVARTLHLNSKRHEQPWVVLDCTTLAANLAESELFGHRKGAFTGAVTAHRGVFERANGGTLFIDEIGDLPLDLQGKLLRVVQDGECRPVGGGQPIQVDVRIVAATHRDLKREVSAGRFREDLYYRLAVLTLPIPALRERGAGDIDALAEHILRDIATREDEVARTLTPEARARLHRRRWPGNVRELRNVLERAVLRSDRTELDADAVECGEEPRRSDSERLADVERAHILGVLARCNGNQSEAARRLGIARNTLRSRLDSSPRIP
ncbi:MAG: sigma-54-dependent Fis family transcriptional regulator [Myxococcota bacterium]